MMSPSSHHLGIYKSLQCHVLDNDKREQLPSNTPLEPIQQGCNVLYLIFDVMALALKHTYTLKQWHTVRTMFKKE